jgi:GNAT superfamily N-acetyltransferase
MAKLSDDLSEPTYLVRLASERDILAICALLFDLKRQYASCSESTLDEFRVAYEGGIRLALSSDFNSIWVAEREDGTILGFLSTTHRVVLRLGGWVGALEEVYVLPGFRRHGIGFALWQAAAGNLRNKGVKTVEVVTSLAHPGQRPYAAKIGLQWYANVHRLSIA